MSYSYFTPGLCVLGREFLTDTWKKDVYKSSEIGKWKTTHICEKNEFQYVIPFCGYEELENTMDDTELHCQWGELVKAWVPNKKIIGEWMNAIFVTTDSKRYMCKILPEGRVQIVSVSKYNVIPLKIFEANMV